MTTNEKFWIDFNNEIKKNMIAYPKLRKGQRYFNALCMVDQELYESLVGTKYDCFYNDSRITGFMNKVMEKHG